MTGGPGEETAMMELKTETSTQKLFWDSENEIVWGELFRVATYVQR